MSEKEGGEREDVRLFMCVCVCGGGWVGGWVGDRESLRVDCLMCGCVIGSGKCVRES